MVRASNCTGLGIGLVVIWVLAVGCASGPEAKRMLPPVSAMFQKKGDSPSSSPALAAAKKPATKTQTQPPKVGPDFFDGMMKGRQLEQEGKLAEARKIYEQLIVQYPHRYEPYHRLGVVADREKRYREAVALYTQAIALQPDPEIFNDLGFSYYLQGQLDKAESALLKAVSMKPANPRFRNNLGMVYGFQGRYEEALEQFRRGGSEADACYNMAFILATQEDLEGAKRYLMLALAADPTHKKAQDALASLEGGGSQRIGANPRHLARDGRRWELYRESSEGQLSGASGARPASYETAPPNRTAPPIGQASPDLSAGSGGTGASLVHKSAPRPDTQALLRQARAMMAQRMAERQTQLANPDSP
ncbi:MAG: tetratricopeptide repeat protein [Thermoguttaceae bacterium]|nr:tetratricopeptide repeat protein [Thermoguttaceae bacterium]MDW8036913.1 tetratricopeptide repeat protein [Thermoguttaceae bacterium]